MKCYHCRAQLPECECCTLQALPSLTKWFCNLDCTNAYRATKGLPPLAEKDLRIPFEIPS
jgi:hypothetical protein